MASAPAPALTPAQLRVAAIVLAFSNFIVVLDMTVANVSVPHIAGSLGVSLEQGSWVITSYSVAEALAVPLTGWLAQRFGTVRMYTTCMTGFGIFSMLCGLSQTLEMIVICRIGQGLCGGLLMPLSQTLLFRIFPGEQRGKAMLLSSMTVLLGPAFGPNLGGLISDNLSWHWIFLVNIPFVIICVMTVAALLTPLETPKLKVPIDVVGLFLLFAWIGSLQYMLDIGRNRDWFADPQIVMLAITALVGFCAFVIWELAEEHPIVNLKVFRHSGFAYGVTTLSLCFGAYMASIVVIPQWLQVTMGYPAVWAGFLASCTAITAITTSMLASKAVTRFDPRILVSLAVAWIGCMALLRSQWTSGTDFWSLAIPQLLQGFGMSFFILPLMTIGLNSVPAEEMPSASGIQNCVRTLAVGVATALAVTIWGDAQQTARSDLVGRLNYDEAARAGASAGFGREQSTMILSQMVDKEAVTIAIDQVFLITAVVFFVAALVIWLAPRPKRR